MLHPQHTNMQSVLKTHSTTGTSRNIQKHLCCVSKSGWVIPASVISSWPLKPGIDEVRRPTVTAWPSTLHEDSVLILCGINWAHPYAVWIWSVEVSAGQHRPERPQVCSADGPRSRSRTASSKTWKWGRSTIYPQVTVLGGFKHLHITGAPTTRHWTEVTTTAAI